MGEWKSMCDTESDADAVDGTALPTDAITGFLEASRNLGQDGYVDTEATCFNDDGTARIVLTHTHQGAFRMVSKLARRFGFDTHGHGNREAGGQRFRHLPGMTPTLRAEYAPDAYNVVMLNAPEYKGDMVAFAPAVAIGVSRAEAVEQLRKRRDSDDYRSDVDYKLQHAGTQTFEEINADAESDDNDDGAEWCGDRDCPVCQGYDAPPESADEPIDCADYHERAERGANIVGTEDGVTIERAGTRTVERRYSDDEARTDLHHFKTTDPEGKTFERTLNAVRIGCPDCKENATAIIRDGAYHCACDYSNELNWTTLIRQGVEVEGTWEPY